MRPIKEIIIHCTGTVPSRSITVETIRNYHVRVKGWEDIGYHFLIDADGVCWNGRNIEKPGAHCKYRNKESIGVAYVGGLHFDGETPMDTRTTPQKVALVKLVKNLMFKYDITQENIHCHNEFSSKACPCFTIESFREELRASM